MASDSSSDLFELKNYFYLGNYQAAINEGNSLSDLENEVDQIERNVFLYRSYIAQGNYQIVLDEIKPESSDRGLQAVRLLATYHQSETNKDSTLSTLREWLADSVAGNNPYIQLIAASIYYREHLYEEAMRAVYHTNSLESLALLAQIYLKINRPDLAEKEVRKMSKMDDDASITQLTSAWLALTQGGERIQEAQANFEHLGERYGYTCTLLNGIAICRMHAGRHAEAEKGFLQALEKRPNDPDTMANLVVCYQQQNKSNEAIMRQMNQLKAMAPKHFWIVAAQKQEENFDQFAKEFALSTA